ncbi:MAG: PLP-dependent aminotransferase family protein [Bifidobacteriaceae bacterium]|jgi:DNA-binding transcriptional MocR family regulator|nr:PLP-dependent aminotransferase family protein [Bifidobacteriaceae bacterium]
MSTNPGGGTRLDPWFGSYAGRTHGLRVSETRALFSVANRPEVVSLAGGMPFLDALPMDLIAKVTADLIATEGAVALQYGNGQGHPLLRAHITQVMAEEKIQAHPDDVVVTTGSQQALDLVTRIFVDPGDVVLAEAPSYVGALSVFKSYQAWVEHVPMDDAGLVPEALTEAVKRLKAAGRRIKFLYTCPTYHNPAGVTLPVDRRAEVLDICQREGILLVEDNPYGMLGFDGQITPAIRSLDEDGVIYLGSFSKTLAPGYRTGWAAAPHAVREKLVLASEASILCPSHASQLSIAAYLDNCDWRGQIDAYRGVYRERCETMLASLGELMPECTWSTPEGGFYTWVTVPEGVNTKTMLPRATTALVAYVSGTAFYADGQGNRQMRLSFCYPTPERIREGVRRLAGVLAKEIELAALFGPAAADAARSPSGAGADSVADVTSPAPDVA